MRGDSERDQHHLRNRSEDVLKDPVRLVADPPTREPTLTGGLGASRRSQIQREVLSIESGRREIEVVSGAVDQTTPRDLIKAANRGRMRLRVEPQ